MGKVKNLLGNRYGKLVAVKYLGIVYRYARWECKCDCGGTIEVRSSHLILGDTTHCGCIPHTNKTHGERQARSKEYAAWCGMKGRCYRLNHPRYKDWGGRGIRVCDRWINSYENFLADMGRAPSPTHSIDRINNDGNYEPGNCRWATVQEQNKNKRKKKSPRFSGVLLSFVKTTTPVLDKVS